MGALFLAPHGSCTHPNSSLVPSLWLFVSAPPYLTIPHFKGGKKCRQMTQTHGLYESRTQLLIPHLSSVLDLPYPGFLFLSVSSLWGHRVRHHQSCWKALPYCSSHAKSALQDSGNGWWRRMRVWHIFLRIFDKVVTFKNSSHLGFIFRVFTAQPISAWWRC